jgi:hypothetical protein
MATSGDLDLATSGDFFMATDTHLPSPMPFSPAALYAEPAVGKDGTRLPVTHDVLGRSR